MADITAVLNFHREGELARSAIASVRRNRHLAEAGGANVQVIAVLDKADAVTENIVSQDKEEDWLVISVHCGDLGLARNAAVVESRGQWVAFLDGDDLWDDNWLYQAWRSAGADNRRIAWHPEVNVYFGDADRLLFHTDMEDEDFDLTSLAFGNAWTALTFVSRNVLIEVPYPGTNLSEGVGFEDWAWNMRIIRSGGLHKTVPGTAHAIRSRRGSLAQQAKAAQALPDISLLFSRR